MVFLVIVVGFYCLIYAP